MDLSPVLSLSITALAFNTQYALNNIYQMGTDDSLIYYIYFIFISI